MANPRILRSRGHRFLVLVAWMLVSGVAPTRARAEPASGSGICSTLQQVLAAAPDHFESLVNWPEAALGEGATSWRTSRPNGDSHLSTTPKLRLPIDFGLPELIHIQSSRPAGTLEPGVTLYFLQVAPPDFDDAAHLQNYKKIGTKLTGCLGSAWTRSTLTASDHRSHLEGLELKAGLRLSHPKGKARVEVRLEAEGDYRFVGVYVITPPDPTRVLTQAAPPVPLADSQKLPTAAEGVGTVGAGFCEALNRGMGAAAGEFDSLKGRDLSDEDAKRYESTLAIPGAQSTIVRYHGIEPGPRLAAKFLETRDKGAARSFYEKLVAEVESCKKPCGTLVRGATDRESLSATTWIPFGGNEMCPPNLKLEVLYRPLPLPVVVYVVELSLLMRTR